MKQLELTYTMHYSGYNYVLFFFFFFSSRRRHTRWTGDWSSDVCSSDLAPRNLELIGLRLRDVMQPGEVRGRPQSGIGLPGAGEGGACPVALTGLGERFRGRLQSLRSRSEERRVGKECRARWSP